MNLRPKSVTFDLDEHWSQVQGLLRTEFDDTAYRTWLAPLDLVGLEGDRVLLAVPTRFLRDWVAAHYADRIRALWHCVNPRVCGIALIVRPASSAPGRRAPARGARAGTGAARGRAATAGGRHRRTARSALHLRPLRRRHVQRSRLRRRQAGRRARRAAVQPAVPLWRRRPRQDPSDACHRLADPAPRTRAARWSTCRPRSSCTSSSRRSASRTR